MLTSGWLDQFSTAAVTNYHQPPWQLKTWYLQVSLSEEEPRSALKPRGCASRAVLLSDGLGAAASCLPPAAHTAHPRTMAHSYHAISGLPFLCDYMGSQDYPATSKPAHHNLHHFAMQPVNHSESFWGEPGTGAQ